MLLVLLAASLLPTQVRLPFPAARVAISGGELIAVSSSEGRFFKGDGKGHFEKGVAFAAGDNPSSIVVADLNGDGKPDLVLAHHERKYFTVHLWPSYAPVQVPVDVTPHTHFAAVADLDGDGKPDVIVNDMGGKRVIVLWGKGDGTFLAPTVVSTGSKGYAYFDVAVLGPRLFVPTWPQPQLAVLRADKRAVAAEALIDLPNPSFYAVALGADVAVATYSGSFADASRDGVVLLRGGKGPARTYPSGHAPTALAAGDVNGDGLPDLAVCNQGGDSVSLLLGTKDGLRAGETVSAPHPQGIALGDLDGDGKADLAVATPDQVILFLTR